MEAERAKRWQGNRPALAVQAWLRLARVFQRVEQASGEHLRRWGISTAQFDVLVHVGMCEGLTQQDLATALLVTKGNICQLVDRIERDGLIRRVPSGRANRLYLTDAGRGLFHQAVPAQEAVLIRSFSRLDGDEQRHLLALLRRLDQALSPVEVKEHT
jgi:DNA-binding MarR family transcriptional regulator